MAQADARRWGTSLVRKLPENPAGWKPEIQNPKSQIPNKFQTLNPKPDLETGT